MRLERSPLSRRAVLAACCVAVGHPNPSWADTSLTSFAEAVRASGDAGLSAWGKTYSNSCSWSSSPGDVSSEAPLPRWLEGRWRVSSKLDSVTFPMGRRVISSTDAIPGKRMVSILPLPNIGAEPEFEIEYSDNVGALRGRNAASTLEAFWPSARVLDFSSPRVGELMLRYESPTRSRTVVAQSVRLQLCSSQGGPTAADEDEWTVAEVFQQDNIEQGTRGEFLTINVFRREGPSKVKVRQRVAAFLQPSDGAYLDAVGKPVALYDYTFRYSRIL